MLRYEILMLANPETTGEQLSEIETHIKEIVTKGKGSMTSFDNWGKLRLSYPVKKHEYGVYALARYELPKESTTETLEEVKTYFRIKANDLVIRHVCKALDKDAPLSYEKPEAAEVPRAFSDRPPRGFSDRPRVEKVEVEKKVEDVKTEPAEG